MKYMKHIFALFICVSACHANAGVIFSFANSSTDVTVNETVTLELLVTTETFSDAITTFNLAAVFDNTGLALEGPVQINSAFLPAPFLVGNEFGGVLDAANQPPLFGANAVLATFTLRALRVGSFDFSLGEIFGGLMPVVTDFAFNENTDFTLPSTQFNVTAAVQASAPAMGFTALIALLVWGRRHSFVNARK